MGEWEHVPLVIFIGRGWERMGILFFKGSFYSSHPSLWLELEYRKGEKVMEKLPAVLGDGMRKSSKKQNSKLILFCSKSIFGSFRTKLPFLQRRPRGGKKVILQIPYQSQGSQAWTRIDYFFEKYFSLMGRMSRIWLLPRIIRPKISRVASARVSFNKPKSFA